MRTKEQIADKLHIERLTKPQLFTWTNPDLYGRRKPGVRLRYGPLDHRFAYLLIKRKR